MRMPCGISERFLHKNCAGNADNRYRGKREYTKASFSVRQIGELIAFCKGIKPDVKIMVDNCYGEFVETLEPTQVGADLVVGSLIKNPGGGLAPTGGYIAGRSDLVQGAAQRLTTPGIGAECGCSLGQNRALYQGLFLAPHTVAQAVKGSSGISGLFVL